MSADSAGTVTIPQAYAMATERFGAGDLTAAEHIVGRIIAARPDIPEAHHLAGMIRLRAGRADEAAESFSSALRGGRTPARLAALSDALRILGRFEEAAAALREAAAAEPTNATVSLGLGFLLQDMGRTEEAMSAFRVAAELGDARAWYALGLRRHTLGDAAGAATAFRKAQATAPDQPEALTGLGQSLVALGRGAEALVLHARALQLNPDRLEDALHGADLTRVGQDFARIEIWREKLAETTLRAVETAEWRLLSSVLYRDLYRPLPSDVRIAAERALSRRASSSVVPPAPPPAPDGRMRVGYLSGCLGNHPIGQVTLSLFAAHDRTRVETHGFLTGSSPETDAYAARHRAGFERAHDLRGLTPAETARRIRETGVEILVHLDGHMDKSGLTAMSLRPAPIRVFWLGHAGGPGAAFADYLIADAGVIPMGEEGLYAERVVRLPRCYHCSDRHPIGPPARRSEHGLPEDGVVLCAFNNIEKIDEAAFAAWMEILSRVPGSVLWLSRPGATARRAEDNLRAFAAARGVAPKRILFAGRVADKRDHLARYQLADLFLDTWTMNASTTALDALWAGVPIVARRGDRFSNRISASMLSAIGMGAMVCPDERAYVAAAVALALNPAMRDELRSRLWSNRETTPLFNVNLFARGLEAAFARMLAIHRAGRPPEAFDLPADLSWGDGVPKT